MSSSDSRFDAALSRPAEAKRHSTGLRVAAAVTLVVFLAIDVAVVARSVEVVSYGQLAASAVGFALIVAGLIVTIWGMEGRTGPRPPAR